MKIILHKANDKTRLPGTYHNTVSYSFFVPTDDLIVIIDGRKEGRAGMGLLLPCAPRMTTLASKEFINLFFLSFPLLE